MPPTTSQAISLSRAREIVFDFGDTRDVVDLAENLSGVVTRGDVAWTVSDEGSTFECFARTGDRYALHQQFSVRDFFPELPHGREVDLESIDLFDDRLWLCGSHCNVRTKPDAEQILSPGIRTRPSRQLLCSIELDSNGMPIDGAGRAVQFDGAGSLRSRLADDPYLQPFVPLPSKENGLDIEGLSLSDDQIFLGLRGPVLDNNAVVIAMTREASMVVDRTPPRLHFLDLGGLGSRDLCRVGSKIVILAGPVTSADGPFQLHLWDPTGSAALTSIRIDDNWPSGRDHPEGICPLSLDGQAGFLVVYDSPDRRTGSEASADWFAASGL